MTFATRLRTLWAGDAGDRGGPAPLRRDPVGGSRAGRSLGTGSTRPARPRGLGHVLAVTTAVALTACGAPSSVGSAPTVTHTVASGASHPGSSHPGSSSRTDAATDPTEASRDAPGTAFTAFGVRTPWRAVVSGGWLSTEGPSLGEHRLPVRREPFARGVDFTGTEPAPAGGTGSRTESKVTLTVRSQSCWDAQGHDTGLAAVLSVGDRQLIGCAVEGAQAQAPT